ncbi:MAG: hypothetical protein ACE5EG_03340 [Thermoanaerobaculia bacterium]
MSTAAVANASEAASRHLDRVVDRLLVWLPALATTAAVAIYLVVHRQLVLGPAAELMEALAVGSWAVQPGPLLSFVLLLTPPAALLVALAVAIWPWSRLYDRRPTLRLLATLTVTSAVIVLLQVALGAAGILKTQTLAVTALGLTALLFVVDRARRKVAPRPAPRPGGRQPMLTAGPFADIAMRLELAPPTHLGILLGAVVAASWLALAAIGALTPPWGWDSLVYHLTDIFWFAQNGTLESFPHPAPQFHFPKVAELHSLWFYLLAGGGEGAWRVTGIALLPAALAAGVAVRAAGELLGLRSALAWLAPATMLIPLALIQPLAGYTDLTFTAFLLTGFAFLLAAVRRGHAADWALAALACGLALGSKLSFVYLCLPLILLLAARPQRLRLRPGILLRIPVCALLFAVGCGFWLLPSLLRTGNPFHPLAVTIAGHTLLEGPALVQPENTDRWRYTDSLAGWLAYPLSERYRGELAYSPDNGFGPQFAAAWLVLPFAVALALRRRRGLLTRALLAAPATLIAWLVFSPWEHPRYALTACGFALLGLAAVEEAASGGPGASPAARRLLRSAILVALLFAAPAGLLAAGYDLPRVMEEWKAGDWQPTDIYPMAYGPAGRAFNWISEHGGDGTTVSFDLHTFVGPLFGWHGRNRVVYAASIAERGVDGLPIAGSSRSWRRFLDRERVDWLVIWSNWWEEQPRPTLRQRWIADHPEAFDEVATFGRTARILAPRGAAAASAPGTALPLAELSTGRRWVLEYATGATVETAPDPAGGVRVDYQFLTSRPDYLDLRFDLAEGDWIPDSRLVFGLDSTSGSPLLWIYLKEADPRRNCRFRIDPRSPATEPRDVVIELARPDKRTPGFALRRTASVHLVLDDAGSSRASSGSFRLHDFRLERVGGATSSTRSSFKEGT